MKIFSVTDMGRKRQVNQDYVFTSSERIGRLPNLFVVADGMGGHNAGDFASKFTVEAVVEFIKEMKEQDPKEILRTAIVKANESLNLKAKESAELEGMGTTLVVATINKDKLLVANVGDSRLYMLNDQITQITADHSLVAEMVRLGEIDKNIARIHPDKNIITRAIGVGPDVKIDFFEVNLKKGDSILMCSDGLTNMIEDEEIKFIIQNKKDIEEKGNELIRIANANGGQDNIAVIIIEPF
ncbi:Stp1/IreP family PP2C-type Ser/Thr phosphatase [Anaerosacchariphilus polymeriproducens]|uniref:Stp1/IreP family PP2C-type Ser/Thr phosphatase n=1 Tax=Anaerosacchariphilus polymeriproducens TaxID=1812858 RepID=UPI00187B2FB6|nr:Stp1/IreP family PP2C-type Ser/Thr phosphatase [Anaerosacchariphilus polymeriproducens]